VLDDLLSGAHLAVRLPGYLYRTIDLEGGSALIRRRIEEREASFLELTQRAIYAQPDSPYRALLEHAGCDQFQGFWFRRPLPPADAAALLSL